MVTMHSVFSSYDNVGWTVGTSFPNLDVAIPAGATLKRFIVSNQFYQGTTNGLVFSAIGNWGIRTEVAIVAGQYATRSLFLHRCALPQQVVGLYDNVALNRVYSSAICAGDQDLLIDQRVSFGTRSGPGFTIRCTNTIVGGLGFTGALANTGGTARFLCIYETLP